MRGSSFWRTFFITACLLMLGVGDGPWVCVLWGQQNSKERIVYAIATRGTSEYNDMGLVEFEGRKVKLITFRTDMPGFDDLEKIYADPSTLLPIRVVREVRFFFRTENIVEEYSSGTSSLVIRKYIRNKLAREYRFTADDPIQSAILLPFYLRTIGDVPPGWSLRVCLPAVFRIKLAGVESVQVPAGTFSAYHFTSEPHKFDVWISRDARRIPLKVVGAGFNRYIMTMKSHAVDPGISPMVPAGHDI